jgi:general L-amino acid transport system permease protein
LTWEAPGLIVIDRPVRQGFNFSGGMRMTPEFAGLLLGLVIYTGAFIAEIVRAGINAVPKGQWEASRALGLAPATILRLVVLPQALRVIIPPLTNQYLNLTKNSSLAIAIGYPDLFNVSMTILNQTGAEVQMFLLIMATYLSISLITSLFMNWYNRRIAFSER